MATPLAFRDGIGRKDLQNIRRRFTGIHRERLKRIEGELLPAQQVLLRLLPLLFHINHPMLPGFTGTATPAGVPDFTPGKIALQTAKKLSRSFEYKKRARRRYQIQGIYLMGSIGSVAHTAGSDLDVWLCHDPELGPRALEALRAKAHGVENWGRELGLEVHIFVMNVDAFRQGKRDTLSHESSGSTQRRLLLEEFYRTGVLLAGRYPLWWLVPPDEEPNYSAYAEMLLHKRFVDSVDCIDFGGLESLSADEFFGAAHWQLYKGIESPYKTILKLLLSEAYSREYPQVRWLCQEAKRAIYEGQTDLDELDPYVLMYRRLAKYLGDEPGNKRLDLARRCLYFKTEQKLSRLGVATSTTWQQQLMGQLTREWGWGPGDLAILDDREHWKIDRVLDERNTLVKELSDSFRLLTDFARTYAHESAINPEELSLLGRKLYTALEKRPGKIDSINPGISRSLEELRVSLHYKPLDGEEKIWLLFLGEINTEQALVTDPIKSTSGLIEMLTWCQINRVVGPSTLVTLYPDNCPVRLDELRSLLSCLQQIYPRGVDTEVPMEQLAAPPHALECTLFVNTGTDPMYHLSRQGKQLTSNRCDPLSFGAAHASLVEQVEQLITTSWGETLVFSYRGSTGLLKALCQFLQLTVIRGQGYPVPEVSAHSYSSVRSAGIARRVAELFNDASRAFLASDGGSNSRYLLQLDDEYYLIHISDGQFGYEALQSMEELLQTLGKPQYNYSPLAIDRMALINTHYPAIFAHNRKDTIQLFFHNEKDRTQLYILDEQGALLSQQLPPTDEHYLLLQQQRFLNGIRMMRSLLAEEPAHRLLLDSPEFFRLQQRRDGQFDAEPRNPPRHRLPDNYLELRLLSDRLDLHGTAHVLLCGEREFTTLEYGERLYEAVAEHVLSQRRSKQPYPIYLTGLELSSASGEGATTIQLFNFKIRLEKRLAAAMDELCQIQAAEVY